MHPGGGGVLQILSDGDDRRIFFGLKCLTPAFFLGGGDGKILFKSKSEFFGYFLCYVN